MDERGFGLEIEVAVSVAEVGGEAVAGLVVEDHGDGVLDL